MLDMHTSGNKLSLEFVCDHQRMFVKENKQLGYVDANRHIFDDTEFCHSFLILPHIFYHDGRLSKVHIWILEVLTQKYRFSYLEIATSLFPSMLL